MASTADAAYLEVDPGVGFYCGHGFPQDFSMRVRSRSCVVVMAAR